jgi:hypothetical protein
MDDWCHERCFREIRDSSFTDMMKSAFNTSLYSYGAITVKRDTDKIDLAAEGLFIEELYSSYQFLFYSV